MVGPLAMRWVAATVASAVLIIGCAPLPAVEWPRPPTLAAAPRITPCTLGTGETGFCVIFWGEDWTRIRDWLLQIERNTATVCQWVETRRGAAGVAITARCQRTPLQTPVLPGTPKKAT